ncbi:PIN domain-containing protein [Janibacter massiliensis]|uniref:PIN domain-containing protein n=1 Tax=Janibacter massiliensis TaxID=2058291 RepID=UPI001F4861C2|nr:PIN domain-containing protein [Janibacter massiliensis]
MFVDANVFFSKTLTDWLFLLRYETEGMFQVHTTEDVCAEVIYRMRKKNPTAPGHFTRRRIDLLRGSLDEIIGDYPADLPFTGADPADYHVHAAATAGRADIVITANKVGDFTNDPDAESYEVMHPDDFFLLVGESSRGCVPQVIEKQIMHWKHDARRVQLDEMLERAGCPEFAITVRELLRHRALRP